MRLKKLMALLADPNAIIVSQDEVYFQQQATVTRKLVKCGSQPTVKSFPGKPAADFVEVIHCFCPLFCCSIT